MSISVIIPALNEAACIAQTLRSVRAEKPREILVVDCGSSDATCELAGEAGRVLHGPRGRPAQMNLGAAHAAGDVLLFLHADCTLEPGALLAAVECLGRRGVVAGCFRMTVTAPGLAYRLLDACATARVRLTGLIYGDQGLFVERRRFERIGGFPALSLMEDLFFSKKLRRQGRLAAISHNRSRSAFGDAEKTA
jgi:rSAM/selenodomain-associated transferase 2